MAIFDRQLQPPQHTDTFVEKNGQLSQFGHQTLQRMWEWMAAGFVTIPCDVTGTPNAIVLTPSKRKDRGASGYATLLMFSFIPTAANTAAATIQVDPLAVLPAYRLAIPVVAGDIALGVPYFAIYCPAAGALPARMVIR